MEPYHPEENLLEREMAHWKNDCKKIIMDQNVDPKGWFKVIEHVADLHNHNENPRKKMIYLPLYKKR